MIKFINTESIDIIRNQSYSSAAHTFNIAAMEQASVYYENEGKLEGTYQGNQSLYAVNSKRHQ